MLPELLSLEKSFGKSELNKINDPFLDQHQVSLWIKRDDLLHPIISGNKWRKLKYNLNAALSSGADTLISMGGTYSNHLHALAYVGMRLNLKTIGIIRSEQPASLTPTLQDMANWGMELHFISRSEYRQYRHYKHWQDLPDGNTKLYWLPEGGANAYALQGIADLMTELDIDFDTVCVATLAGLIEAALETTSVLGFAALKKAAFLQADVQSFLTADRHNWDILLDYHQGGFARITPTLTQFMIEFSQKTAIPLEPVYTGKMLFGLYDLIAKGYFKPGQRIVALHTGGLQGNRGYNL
jgi:1-aminocyclopropane-1-carboxylate deaminase